MWALVTFPHVSHRLWGSLVAYIIGDQISGTVAVWYLFLLCPGTWDFWFGLDPLARYFFILTWVYAIILKWAAFCAYECICGRLKALGYIEGESWPYSCNPYG